jgi:hypothetical protein
VRSQVQTGRVLAEALATVGRRDEALVVASTAVTEAHATQQASERAPTNAVLDALS